MNLSRTLSIIAVVFVVSLVILNIQAAAKNRSNPPVITEPQWNAPETRALAQRACFACHSNQTKWPIYSGLPVVGGLIEKHVIEGRSELNFSAWGVGEREGDEAAEKVFEPLHYAEDDPFLQPPYSWLHPSARLTATEREALARGLIATVGAEGSAVVTGTEAGESETDD